MMGRVTTLRTMEKKEGVLVEYVRPFESVQVPVAESDEVEDADDRRMVGFARPSEWRVGWVWGP